MLNRIIVGSYYPIRSKIHSMNSVVKILCTLIFIVMTFLCQDIKIMLFLTFMCILMIELSHVPKRIYIKTFASIKYLILFLIAIYYFIGSDINTILNMIIRLYIIVIYTMLLTLTTTPNDITYGLQKVMSPLKLIGIPVNRMALSISLALRFIPTIIGQGNKIMKSQASRGVDYYASNLSGKFLAIKSMLIPMFILTIRRADSLSEAMEVRLYDINAKRTCLRERKLHFIDIFLLFIHIGILILLIVRMV